MKICDSWLGLWTQSNLNKEQIIHQFTMAGLEVEEYQLAAPPFNQVVVAEVLEAKRHPQADKLSVCQVNNGQQVVQIVCGAPNVRQGLKVALAMPGAELPNGMKISEAKLRGETSSGMLCSTNELGCADGSDGIWELPKDAPVGKDLREYLNLDEGIYGFELTPNRGDCFSAIGLTRELTAITGTSFKEFDIKAVVPTHHEIQTISVQNPQWNPLYCGRKIKNIKPYAVTPLWLKETMRRLGLRTVHPVVDVLNYVMYLLGQPMHAFDCHKIGAHIDVREAKAGETITLLNGKTAELSAGTPVITNGVKPIAIAGVMGSEDSAVDDDTSEIFLESAFFNPVKLSGVARSYGLSTDASIRYERGVDPELAVKALEFATDLLLSIVGGEPGPIEVLRSEMHLPKAPVITFDPKLFSKRTGVELSLGHIETLLMRLGFGIEKDALLWQVTVPSYRFDIFQDVDLVEEILRLYGYDNIPTVALVGELVVGRIDEKEQFIRRLSMGLKHLGYHEAINYAFVDPKLQDQLFPTNEAIRLLNPISPELANMRVSLWPGLISSLLHNINRQQTTMQLFESGTIFLGTAEQAKEQAHVAGLLYGPIQALNWCGLKDKKFDFFDAKGHMEHLLHDLGYDELVFSPSEYEGLHPGQTAAININGVLCGMVGVLHPKLVHDLECSYAPILWFINLSELPAIKVKKYKTLSKFPFTRRDISFLIHKEFSSENIIHAIKSAVSDEVLKTVQIFDVYQGKEIEPGFVSIAVTCTFQDDHKTLIEDDILSYQSAILKVLTEQFHIKLRDGL